MSTAQQFQKIIWTHYRKSGRHSLPWRHTHDPYKILVSEIMLQQTQVDRVIPKYTQFIKRFPTLQKLAKARTSDVIREWQGLGYNRRALNLKHAAEMVVREHAGKLPRDYDKLVALPGIGPYTAGAILAFSWNEPMVFVETNIRTVFLHHFFKNKTRVTDTALESKIAETLPTDRAREWYWALMDYGAYLKKTVGNASTRSRHYAKQSTFKGSNRQLRGAILRTLSQKRASAATLSKAVERDIAEVKQALAALQKEGFVRRRGSLFLLA